MNKSLFAQCEQKSATCGQTFATCEQIFAQCEQRFENKSEGRLVS